MSLRIKNWKQFQHYKDRCPPWIKLYKDLLNDPDWYVLDDGSSKVLVNLWLIASEDCNREGYLPDIRGLAFRLRMKEEKVLKHLQQLRHWVVQDDSDVLADRLHDATPETETEGETEKESCATDGRTESTEASDEQSQSDNEEPFYKSKKRRKLKGKALDAFEEFWEAFDDKRGRAEAADAFLDVYSEDIHDDIISGARSYALERQALINKGQTPKMAQGWLSGRRWEDELIQQSTSPDTPEYMQGVQ